MSVFSKNMSELVDKYKFWVCRNPEKVRFIENYSALILTVLAGKITQSNILYDWISLGSRLFSFFNNYVLNAPDIEDMSASDKIKIFTTILEYAEICQERTALHLTGQSGRQKLIVFLQCFKLFLKLSIHLYYKERIVCCPYSYYPDDIPRPHGNYIPENSDGGPYDLNTHFVLKRSGRFVRMAHSAPPLYSRLWKPPVVGTSNSANYNQLQKMLFIGELLYLFKPVVTIGAIKKYGYGTWKPWTISLIMDLASLYLINYPNSKPSSMITFTPAEREEMGRRLIGLLLYVMRSPFYERHTRDRLHTLLSVIPFLGRELKDHLEFYLKMYFFLWSK